MGKATKLELAGINRAELPPNPNGGYAEELVAVGKNAWVTRYVIDDRHPLALARRLKRISELQYQAGLTYREKASLIARKGKDSTMALLVSGGGDCTSMTDAQCDASTWVFQVNFLLNAKHRHIVQQVCGLGETPAKAIRMIMPKEAKNVTMHFQHALDALGEAILKNSRVGRLILDRRLNVVGADSR